MNANTMIITCQADSYGLCLSELISAVNGVKLVKWLERGVGIVSIPGAFEDISDSLQKHRLIFLRHIFPIHLTIPVFDFSSPEGNIEADALVSALAARMDSDKTFSVQIRIVSSITDDSAGLYNKHDAVHFFSDKLVRMGFELNTRDPFQALSAVICEGILYAGVSRAKDNLSSWAGGMRRYKKYDGQLSRAEFKLLEAIETFSLDIPSGGLALDLGAAPGGWTRVLLDSGMNVVCVDPAELSEDIAADPRVKHFKGRAQDYTVSHTGQFDLIVNDMRIDTADSARIMLELCDRLRPGGIVIMTFKLPKAKQMAVIKKGLEIMESRYTRLHAGQLFHNRSEITVVMNIQN